MEIEFVIWNFSAESGVLGLHREFLDITPLNINLMGESFKINWSFAYIAWKAQILRQDENHIKLIDGAYELLVFKWFIIRPVMISPGSISVPD